MIYVCYSLPSTFSFVREVILASRKDINQHVIFTDTWGIFYFDGLRFVLCETFRTVLPMHVTPVRMRLGASTFDDWLLFFRLLIFDRLRSNNCDTPNTPAVPSKR